MKKVIPVTSFVSFALFVFFVLALPAFADDKSENLTNANQGAAGVQSSSAPANEIPMFAGVKKTPEQLKADSDFVELAIKEKGSRAAAADHMVKRGWEACDQNDFATAARRFNQAWLIEPDNAKVYHGFGVWAGKQQKIGDAVRYLLKAVELCGTDPAILYDLGFAYNICAQMSQDKPEQKKKYLAGACGIFEKASKLEGVKDILFDSWAAALYQLGDYEKALEKLEIQKKMGGKVSQEKIDHIKGLINKNEKLPAAQHSAAPAKDSAAPAQDVNFYFKSGANYYFNGEYDKAVSDFDRAVELDPDDCSAYCNRGSAYERKGDYEKAISDYNKAVELNPEDKVLYFNRGLIYESNGDADRALNDLNKAIEVDPKYYFAYNHRGLAYYNKGDYDKAISDLSKTIESGFEDLTTYYNRGLAYKKLGEKEKAQSDFNKAIELNPKFSAAYCNRGTAYFNKSDYDKAISDFDKAVEFDPGYSSAYNNRGWAYYNKGQHDRAIADYDKAAALDPKSWKAYNNRALAYFKKGMYDNAISDCNKAIELDPNNTLAAENLKAIQDKKNSSQK